MNIIFFVLKIPKKFIWCKKKKKKKNWWNLLYGLRLRILSGQ